MSVGGAEYHGFGTGQVPNITLYFRIVALGLSYQQGSGLSVQGVGRVRITKELREEDLEDVDHIEHGRPSLVDDV